MKPTLAALIAEEASKRAGGVKCTVCRLVQTLPKGDSEALVAALCDSGISGPAIARALTAAGHDMGPTPVQKHRRDRHEARR